MDYSKPHRFGGVLYSSKVAQDFHISKISFVKTVRERKGWRAAFLDRIALISDIGLRLLWHSHFFYMLNNVRKCTCWNIYVLFEKIQMTFVHQFPNADDFPAAAVMYIYFHLFAMFTLKLTNVLLTT